MGDLIPRDKQYPVWLFMSVWTASEASILHTKLPDPSDPTINRRWIVALTYPTNLPSFFQSPTLGHFILFHKNSIATCRSGRALLATYRKQATIRWNRSAVVSSSFRYDRLTENRSLVAGVTFSPSKSAGGSDKVSSR